MLSLAIEDEFKRRSFDSKMLFSKIPINTAYIQRTLNRYECVSDLSGISLSKCDVHLDLTVQEYNELQIKFQYMKTYSLPISCGNFFWSCISGSDRSSQLPWLPFFMFNCKRKDGMISSSASDCVGYTWSKLILNPTFIILQHIQIIIDILNNINDENKTNSGVILSKVQTSIINFITTEFFISFQKKCKNKPVLIYDSYFLKNNIDNISTFSIFETIRNQHEFLGYTLLSNIIEHAFIALIFFQHKETNDVVSKWTFKKNDLTSKYIKYMFKNPNAGSKEILFFINRLQPQKK